MRRIRFLLFVFFGLCQHGEHVVLVGRAERAGARAVGVGSLCNRITAAGALR
jgi:hypothetical protein